MSFDVTAMIVIENMTADEALQVLKNSERVMSEKYATPSLIGYSKDKTSFIFPNESSLIFMNMREAVFNNKKRQEKGLKEFRLLKISADPHNILFVIRSLGLINPIYADYEELKLETRNIIVQLLLESGIKFRLYLYKRKNTFKKTKRKVK